MMETKRYGIVNGEDEIIFAFDWMGYFGGGLDIIRAV